MDSDECDRWNWKTRMCSIPLTACNFFPHAWLDGPQDYKYRNEGEAYLDSPDCVKLVVFGFVLNYCLETSWNDDNHD
jgi:hypothetical protein